MSKEFLETGVAKIDLESGDHPISDAVSAKLTIKVLPEGTHELNDEQSKGIAGGRSRYELIDEQLEALAGGKVTSVIHIIGFEN